MFAAPARGRAVVVALGGAALALFLAHAPPLPVMEPDSASYIHFSAFRTAGYPLFLDLVGTGGATLAQSILAAAALTWLGWRMLALTGSAAAAAVLMLSVAANPLLVACTHTILSESLFTSLFMILLGMVMRLSQRSSLRLAVAASVVAGLMIAVRPAGWFLLPLMVLAAAILRPGAGRRARLGLTAALVVPLLAVAGLERGYARIHFGGGAGSTLMRQIYAKAGMIEAPPTGGSAPAAAALETGFAPVRALIARAPDVAVATYFSTNYEICLEYACAQALGIDPESAAARRAAFTRIAADPGGFAALAWRNYRALWTVYGASHPGEAAGLAAFVRASRPLPFEAQVPVLTAAVVPVPAARLLQPAVLAIGVATALLAALGLAAAVRRPSLPPAAAAAVIAALAVHGELALVALTGVGLPRYGMTAWPGMMVALACAGWWIAGPNRSPPDAGAPGTGKWWAL